MADQEVEDALARSFLAGLPPELVDGLRAEGERADYPAGTTVYRAGSDAAGGAGCPWPAAGVPDVGGGPAGHGPVRPAR